MREILDPRTMRVCHDSSTNEHPCFFSHRRSSLAFTIKSNHLWLLRQAVGRTGFGAQVNAAINYTVILEREADNGYVATAPVLPGCVSYGDTREEVLKNIREAIELYVKVYRLATSWMSGPPR
jgi:predicted RNase H-like HicB family nuclease